MKIFHGPKIILLILLVCLMGSMLPSAAQTGSSNRSKDTVLVYVGTYTSGKSEGIYLYHLDLASGTLSPQGLAAEAVNPSFLAIHPKGNLLYAVNEIGNFQGERSGGVSAYSLDLKTGGLTLLNQQPSGGGAPCHLVVDKTGQHVLLANYSGGNVASLPIGKNGSLGEATSLIQHEGSSVNPNRQKGPHAHSINLDPGNRFAVAADLGVDKLFLYQFHPKSGALQPNDPPYAEVNPGAGPRHFAFHPKGRHAYVINELQCTVTAFSFDHKKGELREIQTLSTLPEDEVMQSGYSTAEVQVHPSGKFLFGSNRGHDSIVVYSIDAKTGLLTHVQNQGTGGRTPRNFGIDPTGRYLLAANQNSDSIVVFQIDSKSGRLSQIGDPVEAPSPVCVKFLRTK
jgi:6-phosphogluconolactonase